MQIAVLGGGHGACAAAADLSETGHAVRLWRRDGAALRPLIEAGAITLTDWRGTRGVALSQITADLGEAVAGAALIVIPLPATAHAELAPALAPHLSDGQAVFLPPGTFGGYLILKAMRAAGNDAAVAVAETGTLPYLARKQAPDHVRISVHATRLPSGVMPARDSERALALVRAAYPAIEPMRDLLDGALMNAGPIIHPPLILMNAGPLQHFEAWDIHNEGTQPAIRRVTDALDGERIGLREALGYGPPHFPLADHYDDAREEWMYGNASHRRLTDSGDWREPIDLLHHRYMREDTVIGLSLLSSLGAWAGRAMPLVDGMLAMASAILGQDARAASDRTLAAMGLDGLDRAGWDALLADGPPA